ncbi:MAG: glycosyltransferase family protein [Sulfuricaulis sp.]
MKINYVAYFDPFCYRGGGEMVMREVIESGRRRSHDIRLATVRPRRTALHDRPDLTFIADVFNYPATLKSLGAFRRFRANVIEELVGRSRFVHLNNAYADVCNLPYLPCSGTATPVCPHKSVWQVKRNLAALDFGHQCFAGDGLVQRLFRDAALNIFVSPLHQRTVYRVLGLDTSVPSYVMKPVIDGTRFQNQNRQRDIEYLFVGVIGEAKGLRALRDSFRDKDIWLIGRVAPGERLDFGRHLGQVPYEQIPGYMNRAKNFVFLPRWPEPQGRVVVEAALCGCRLITNENVGATSFPFDISDIKNFQNSTDELWGAIEGLVH